jgi:type VI secretion system secreted protein VgrG
VAKFSQDDRPLSIDTPLGKDKVVLTSFTGTEQMSGLFHFQLNLLSNDGGVKPNDLLGKPVTFKVIRQDGSYRPFNGIVKRMGYGGKGDRGHIYRIEVVPWLWFLTRTTDCRIFQNKSIPDIISQVFQDLGKTDFTKDLQGSHKPMLYCVQYRETDFDFVSRLMEEEGIFYSFKHEEGKHTLVLADHKGSYKDVGDSKVQLKSALGQPEFLDQLQSWEHMHEFTAGKWAHTDYDMEKASTSLMSDVKSKVKTPGIDAYEFYDYPGYRREKGDLKDLVALRIEEEEANYDVVKGTSYCRTFSPGGKFELEKHHIADEQGKKYALLSVEHEASLGGSYVSGAEKSGFIYKNSFTCIPDSVTFRPPRTTY